MANIKIFNINGKVRELEGSTVALEKELQTVIEQNMETFFGVSFLASEYVTSNGGRIDSLGLDENNCPVIFEYKRNMKENVINQGLFYLHWLLDHQGDFILLAQNKFGISKAEEIDWSMPRLICIAEDFTKYDAHAVYQMSHSISLVRYRKFEQGLLMFEQINETIVKPKDKKANVPFALNASSKKQDSSSSSKSYLASKANISSDILNIYQNIQNYILSCGDDVSVIELKHYVAFKKIKNIACIELFKSNVVVFLKLKPATVIFEEGFSKDVSNLNHYGTGDVKVIVKTKEDFEKLKPLLDRAYLEN